MYADKIGNSGGCNQFGRSYRTKNPTKGGYGKTELFYYFSDIENHLLSREVVYSAGLNPSALEKTSQAD